MNPTKKHQSLSFNINDYLTANAEATKYEFPSFPVIGKQNVTFQLNYQEFDASDAVLKLEQSLDNTNFDDLLDCLGAPVVLVLDNTHSSATINLAALNTAFLRATIIFNTVTEGNITSYSYLTL